MTTLTEERPKNYGYNPAFVQRLQQQRALRDAEELARRCDPWHAIASPPIAPEIAPQLAAATLLRRAHDAKLIAVLFQDDAVQTMFPERGKAFPRVVMLQAAIIHLIGRWAGEDGVYHGSPLQLARLAHQSGASFVQECLRALASRDLLERCGAARDCWKLTADGQAVCAALSGNLHDDDL